MKTFMDFLKRKEEKNYWLDKSGSLPVWVIEPPEQLQTKDEQDKEDE